MTSQVVLDNGVERERKSYVHDVYGNVTSVTVSGPGTRPMPGGEREPPGGLRRLRHWGRDPVHYDANGNPVRMVGRNGTTTTFTYDGLDRLISRSAGKDGRLHLTKFTYTLTGRRATMING